MVYLCGMIWLAGLLYVIAALCLWEWLHPRSFVGRAVPVLYKAGDALAWVAAGLFIIGALILPYIIGLASAF